MLTRPVAAILIVVLLSQTAGCAVRQLYVRPSELTPAERSPAQSRVLGLTTLQGADIWFDSRAPVGIARDTLRATVQGAPYSIPLSEVQRVWVRRADGSQNTKSAILVALGVAGLALFAWALSTIDIMGNWGK